jgi:hypothetical protein
MVNAILSRAGDAAPMQWDGVTLKAFAGAAAVMISGVVLLARVRPVVPMMGVVAGIAAYPGPASNASSSAPRLSKRSIGWQSRWRVTHVARVARRMVKMPRW